MRITILITFLIIFGLFLAAQIPVTITGDQFDAAISDAIAQVEAQDKVPTIDEDEVAKAVQLAAVSFGTIEILEARQKKRIRFFASAYFVIWLVFILYLLKLGKQQKTLDQRLAQLEQDTEESVE